jgi:hypothetical protein
VEGGLFLRSGSDVTTHWDGVQKGQIPLLSLKQIPTNLPCLVLPLIMHG